MSLKVDLSALTPVKVLNPKDAADTAAATSAKIALAGYEGIIAVMIMTGVIDGGSVTYTFLTDSDGAGTGEEAVVPLNGAATVITTSNDDGTPQILLFDVAQLKGYLQVVGTVVTGGVLVGYAAFGQKKIAA